MLNPTEELAHLRGTSGGDAPGLVETLHIDGSNAEEVLDRARGLWESVLIGFDEGLKCDDPEWSSRLPRWFVDACSPQMSDEERERWLTHWRSLDRAGKAQAEADLGWTMVDWLAAVDRDSRAWWWWATNAQAATLDVLVDGWPAPLASAEWMLLASGASTVQQES
ncbi:hypothetical protein [Aeromicrobium sp.]|uniref:hypothetical protein n=1 Tax=Aeromicrobium sp. TaxID=1871063 RepID=UPI002FC8289A